DDAHADALRLGGREGLDLAAVHAHLGVAAVHRDDLDLLAGSCLGDQPLGELGEPGGVAVDRCGRAHAAVPPTVIRVTRSVGVPSPTGTPWPSLPHVPGWPISKSLPMTSMSCSTCGPLPMRLPSRIGSVIAPFSM